MKKFSVDNREFYSTGRIIKICGLINAWYEDVENPETLAESLKKFKQRLDIFTFFQRVPHTVPKFNYYMEPYNVAVIKVISYDDWWNNCIGKTTRQAVKKSHKNGVEVRIKNFDDEFVQGICNIYDETPIRQGKRFPHYMDSIEKVRRENGTFIDKSLFLGAYYANELIGFMKVVFEDEFADVLQLLSKISHRDKSVNNALLARAVDICAARGVGYIAYGDLGSGGLDDFKRHNGFSRMVLPKYFIPLNCVGTTALMLNLHKKAANLLPEWLALMLKGLRRRWYNRSMKCKE